jgi:hypothetical protein
MVSQNASGVISRIVDILTDLLEEGQQEESSCALFEAHRVDSLSKFPAVRQALFDSSISLCLPNIWVGRE